MTSMVSADITISESVRNVFYRGLRETVGSIFMRMDDDDFAGASPEAPIFIRIMLGNDASLSHTLVDLNSSHPPLNQKVYLVVYLNSEDENLRLTAPPNAIAIVRWVAGEDEIWLAVQSSSSSWIKEGEDFIAPNQVHEVSWLIGISASHSGFGYETPSDKQNLPFNTRNLALDPNNISPEDAVSTLFCFDFSQSTLTFRGRDALFYYLPYAFGPEAEIEPGLYVGASGPLPIRFGASFEIARGKNRRCDAVPINSEPLELGCGAGPTELGWSRAVNLFQLSVNCLEDSENIATFLYNGAKLTLAAPENASFGFEESAASFIGDGLTGGTPVLHEPFTLHDRTLYRKLDLVWNDGFRRLENYPLLVEAALDYFDDGGEHDFLLEWTLTLTNADDPRDNPPFIGPEQERHCPPVDILIAKRAWRFGALGCRLATGRMLPHLTRSTGGFVTDLIIANIGAEQAGLYLLTAYSQTGDFLGTVDGALAPNQTLRHRAADLFGPNAGYAVISGDPRVVVTAVYRADREGAGPAHVGASTVQAKRWRIYPGNPEVTWDGIALVNTGAGPADVIVELKDFQGNVLATQIIGQAVAPGEKFIYLFSTDFDIASGAYFEVETDTPSAVVALRGNLASDFLWENAAIPLTDQTGKRH